MRPIELKEQQTKMLLVLKKIIEICEKEAINYFLCYGSLIGAVRHQGYIPWDDDIDIGMMRPDYERFISYCIENKESLKPFELLHYRTSKKYIYPIARFSDTRYHLVNDFYKDYGLGLFVDIYPFDYFDPNDKKFMRKRDRMARVIYLNCCRGLLPSYKSKSHVRQVFINCYSVFRFLILNKKYFLRKIDNMCHNYSKHHHDYIGCVVWGEPIAPYKTEWFQQTKKALFENIDVVIPSKYDEILRSQYGDYMQLPKKEEQIAHHCYKAYEK